MRRALVTGSGMLASALRRIGPAFGLEPISVPHAILDVTDRAAVEELIARLQPETIFHAAALTRVNQCEQEPQLADAVNRVGTANVTAAAKAAKARLVYFSTDYVFDGSTDRPWLEDDKPCPLNAYGRSKLAGEEIVRGYDRGHIVRTSGIFGARSDGVVERNFARAITERLLTSRDQIPVVADQFTALTFSDHLAQMVLTLLIDNLPDLVHLTSEGSESWYSWARRICRMAGDGEERINAASSEMMSGGTPRPAYSVLSSRYPEIRSLIMEHPVMPALKWYIGQVSNVYRQGRKD